MTARQARRRCAGIGLVVLALSLGITASSLGGNRASAVHYEGEAGAFKPAAVELTLRGNSGRFDADRLHLQCEPQGATRRSPRALRLHFTSRRHFEGERYVLRPDGFQSFYRVVGSVNRRGTRATGILFYFEVPLDAPGAPQRPDCAGRGQFKWQATTKR